MNRLEGKTALVIGSATGIGREVARLFAAEGAAVALGDREPGALEELAPQIGAVSALAVDVTREPEVAAAIAQAIAQFGQLDVLVNNAGVGGGASPLHEQSAEVWQRVLDVNL
jgi:NAD(P)-dependent dehydrogenase (short-subunit alcohol dehydrogenase family)